MKKPWTPQEITYLKENKGKITHQEMADHLNRTVDSVHRKISRLQITNRRSGSRLTNGTKKCSKCQSEKPARKFCNNRTRKDGKDSWCKDCTRWKRMLAIYGVTEDAYSAMYQSQAGMCGICRHPQALLFLDHDHATGAVRKLLCRDCNFMLKFAQDEPARLAAAVLYLKQHGIRLKISGAGPLPPEFLIQQKKCCKNGCKNCPY